MKKKLYIYNPYPSVGGSESTLVRFINSIDKNICILLSPIIPISSEKILNTMNLKDENKQIKDINKIDIFNHNLEFKKISILFKKIEDDN